MSDPQKQTASEDIPPGQGDVDHGMMAPVEVNGDQSDEGAPTQTNVGRKPRACLACRKLKMRCEVTSGSRKCKRCHRKSLVCEYSRVSWESPSVERNQLDSIQDQLRRLQKTLDMELNKRIIESPKPVDPESPSNRSTTMFSRDGDHSTMAMTRENSPEPSGGSHLLVTEPMGSLYEVTRLRNIRNDPNRVVRSSSKGAIPLDDFISRGVIGEDEAQDLYETFHTSLNHYLWVGLEQIHTSFESMRKSSQLLTATVLTVTALHMPTSAKTFDSCYQEFLSLISSSMFSRYHSVDDVRGLCIAAFWLSDVSWKLSGHAIRIATELGIHQSFFKALEGDAEHFLRARLWYMLYVCDHHFSIAYGRPPMISESLQIREHELFLHSPHANSLDFRILSQVSLFQILTRVHDRFAARKLHQDHHDASLSEANFAELRMFNLEIDQWRIKWHSRQSPNRYIGSFPPKGIILYSYFAKLQLNSFAVRGLNTSPGCVISTERKEFANMAISAAASILTFVLEEEDLRRAMVGTPLYVHTMIAFASVFLMNVVKKGSHVGLNIEPVFVWTILERMIGLLKSTVTSDRHLLYHIASGLEKMMAKEMTINPRRTPTVSYDGSLQHLTEADSLSSRPFAPPADFYSRPTSNTWTTDLTSTGYPGADDPSLNQMMFMSDNMISEAFGSEPATDVYNLLTSQFGH